MHNLGLERLHAGGIASRQGFDPIDQERDLRLQPIEHRDFRGRGGYGVHACGKTQHFLAQGFKLLGARLAGDGCGALHRRRHGVAARRQARDIATQPLQPRIVRARGRRLHRV